MTRARNVIALAVLALVPPTPWILATGEREDGDALQSQPDSEEPCSWGVVPMVFVGSGLDPSEGAHFWSDGALAREGF